MSSSCLPVTSIFSSITCFRSQFLRKMGPIHLVFLRFIVRRVFLSYLTLCNTSSFLKLSVQMTFPILFQHHILLTNHPLLQTEFMLWNWSRKHVQLKLVDVFYFSVFSHM
jgi:hypothetical protein